jgi:hypothetical protein
MQTGNFVLISLSIILHTARIVGELPHVNIRQAVMLGLSALRHAKTIMGLQAMTVPLRHMGQ